MEDKLKTKIAYFCMEYGLDEELPLYAGGLGILAGDYLKAAKKIDAPIVGIGIRWWQDYTHQYINNKGYPYDEFPINELEFLEDTGVSVDIEIEHNNIPCKIYKVEKYNNAPLYLLDTGHPDSEFGWITDRLYSGNKKERIAQEILLGIGGVKALRALNIEVDKYHFNEGHAAFAGIKLINEKMNEENLSLEDAIEKNKENIIFTTHTPVPAGNEKHNLENLQQMGLDKYLSRNQLVKIGGDPFDMTAACLKMSSIANGVSKLHQKTAQNMWKNLDNTGPIISVTNGVNVETWQAPEIKKAYENDKDIWEVHLKLKNELVNYIKENTNARMNPENLIIGFARRAAPYKRGELIFRDTSKIEEHLKNGSLQLVFSGKAHPEDHYGKNIVASLVKMDQKYEDSVVFLENYNMEIAKYLTRGCDVWLNNPRRPLEASGTSGMKVAMNGGLNLSVLDGWVAEGVEHGTHGWIFDEIFPELDETLGEDKKDMEALYKIINEEVIPTYYDNREKWIEMMKASIEMSHYDFSAERMVKEYYDKMYSKLALPL
ncbi:MAG: alpha-glucan family phosphorylase [Halanaerobiaceae bacterium]